VIPRLGPRAGFREFAAAFLPAGEGQVAAFEREFAAAMGSARAVAFPYGRTALLVLLEALGIAGREVIVPSYTCVVVAHAVVASGNEPVFVDCEPGGFNMDLRAASRAVTPETAAILPTSLYGHPPDLDDLDAFRAEHPQVRVIQDCALSYDASLQGRPVHREGDAAIFSCNAGKILFSIFGGLVVTDDPTLADRLVQTRGRRLSEPGPAKSLRRRAYLAASLAAFHPSVYGAVHALSRSGLLDRFVKYFDGEVIDMPADHLEGLTAVEARVGRMQLRAYDANIAERRAMAAYYARELEGLPGLVLPPYDVGATWSHYVIRVQDRERLIEHAAAHGVELGVLFPYAVPGLGAYRGRPGCRGAYPEAESLAGTVVNLPLSAGLRGASRTASLVKAFFQKRVAGGGGGRKVVLGGAT
jgi:dTDP-4-amino-4,6-dideoxygalactose transaminase